jgi:hypothetical protein
VASSENIDEISSLLNGIKPKILDFKDRIITPQI